MCRKIFCLIISLCMLFSISIENVFANEGELLPDAENVIKAELVSEENEIKVYKFTIPIVWTSYDKSAENNVRAASDCDCYMVYMGNGVWEYGLTYKAADLIKSIRGNLSTYGVGGSTSTEISASNLVPTFRISAHTELHYLHPVQSGYQFFKISGTVTGVNGYGSFGPQTDSLYVTVE